MHGDKGQYLFFIHLHGFTRAQVVCHYNGRFPEIEFISVLPAQGLDQAVGNILHIRRPCLHIIIIHSGKHFSKVFACHSHSIFRPRLLCPDYIIDGVQIIFVFQHHLMNFKNRSTSLAYFYKRLVVKFLQLLLRCLDRLFNPLHFILRIFRLAAFHFLILFFQDLYRTHCNPFIHWFPIEFYHTPLPPQFPLIVLCDIDFTF